MYYVNVQHDLFKELLLFVGEQQQISIQVRNSLIAHLRALEIVNRHYNATEHLLSHTKEAELLQRIKDDHPIRSRFPKWHRKRMLRW